MLLDKIRTRELIITDSNDKEVIVLRNTEHGPGIWLTSPNGDVISIYCGRDQVLLGVYDEGNMENLQVGIGMGGDGKPVLQFSEKGRETISLSYDQLLSLISLPSHKV